MKPPLAKLETYRCFRPDAGAAGADCQLDADRTEPKRVAGFDVSQEDAGSGGRN